jgi:hypothetical protein
MMTTHARHSRTPVRPAEELPLPRGGLRLNAGGFSGLLIAAALLLSPSTGRALPSFARQLNMQCIMCHTEYPVLNQFGRQFKLTGYTLAADDAAPFPPFAIMVQPSFTHTQKSQEGGAAPGFGDNNNWAVTQLSVFFAGRLFGPYAADLFGKDAATFANKFGVFSQMTYDGVGKTWSWDNTELRFADTGTIAGKDAVYGFYLNNNPMLQDPWNSTPAWGYPFTGSGLAPGPAAATLIDGRVSGQVGGAGAYLWLDSTYYFDVGAYRTLGAHLQSALGVDPTGETQITGMAPYWRFAMEKMIGDARWEFGTFGMAADTYPGRDFSAGKDRIVDLGLDSQYQLSSGTSDLTATLSWIHEHQTWNASSALENTSNAADTLQSAKATVHYLYDKTYGATVQYFIIDGSSDPLLYPDSQTGSPNSDGFTLQFNYLPFNKGGGPAFWPRSNVKLSLQYTIYNRFDGARTNYDGAGANARDNNTLYLEAWIVF